MGLKKWYKKQEKKAKKHIDKAVGSGLVPGYGGLDKKAEEFVKGMHEPGIIGPGSGSIDRRIGKTLAGKRGERRAREFGKYAPGKGMEVQLGKDVGAAQAYLNPEEPDITPDPQIAEDKKREDARRRNRAMGRAFLMTSRQPSKLGV